MVELAKLLLPEWLRVRVDLCFGLSRGSSGGWGNGGLKWAPLADIAEGVGAWRVVPTVVGNTRGHTGGNTVTVERASIDEAIIVKCGTVSPLKLTINELATNPQWDIIWVKATDEVVLFLGVNRGKVGTVLFAVSLSPTELALGIVVLVKDLVLAILESWPVWTDKDRSSG